MKRSLSLLCIICFLLGMGGCSNRRQVTVYDATGEIIAKLSKSDVIESQVTDKTYRSYVQFVWSEAVNTIADMEQCSTPDAEEKLLREGYALHTAFDSTIHHAIDAMYADCADQELALGCAIIDYEGNVRAVYSGGDDQYALMGQSLYSTIKPLSVYAPAVEKGLIDWSTTLPDTPYKQIQNKAGKMVDWPENASQTYSYKDTFLVDCIKKSLNTTAVHCLSDVGVANSIQFLQDSFGMDLSYEQRKLEADGEEEVIGNIAMGYLRVGVTPIELAGYYQIFGNGGRYIRPSALNSITDSNGQTIYTRSSEAKQVIREDTAYIMNRLLSAVITAGGTGAKARLSGIDVVGKTGTDVNYDGNWFAGLTPEYSCAIWHAIDDETSASAAAMFAGVMENMPEHTVTRFAPCTTVNKDIYCSQSGKLFSFDRCSQMQIGYYVSGHKPMTCDGH